MHLDQQAAKCMTCKRICGSTTVASKLNAFPRAKGAALFRKIPRCEWVNLRNLKRHCMSLTDCVKNIFDTVKSWHFCDFFNFFLTFSLSKCSILLNLLFLLFLLHLLLNLFTQQGKFPLLLRFLRNLRTSQSPSWPFLFVKVEF